MNKNKRSALDTVKQKLQPMLRIMSAKQWVVLCLSTVAVISGVVLMMLFLGGDDNPFTGTEPVTTEAPRKPLTYEEYNSLSAKDQEAYFNSFASIEDFFAWYNLAKEEYESSQSRVEIGGDGDVDIDIGVDGSGDPNPEPPAAEEPAT